MSRRLWISAALLLLVATVLVVWAGGGLVPPGMLLRHGPRPGPRPTGETCENRFGMEFVEISDGAFRMGSHVCCEPGDLVGRIRPARDIGLGTPAVHGGGPCGECPREWVEIDEPFWIARREDSWREICELLDRKPADVSPEVVEAFLAFLGDGEDGSYRLPTEIEWEAAALAGAPVVTEVDPEPGWPQERLLSHIHGSAPWPPPRDPSAPDDSTPDPREAPNAWGLIGMEYRPDEYCAEPLSRPASGVWISASHPKYRLDVRGPVQPGEVLIRVAALGRVRDGALLVSRYRTGRIGSVAGALSVRPVRDP